MTHHPDKNNGSEESTLAFQRVSAAFEVITKSHQPKPPPGSGFGGKGGDMHGFPGHPGFHFHTHSGGGGGYGYGYAGESDDYEDYYDDDEYDDDSDDEYAGDFFTFM